MTYRHRSVFACATLLALAGCASTPQQVASRPAPVIQPTPSTQYQPRFEEDAAYVARVETMARIRGIDVHWVNRPVKRTADQASAGRQ